jgi:hypothetical protein
MLRSHSSPAFVLLALSLSLAACGGGQAEPQTQPAPAPTPTSALPDDKVNYGSTLDIESNRPCEVLVDGKKAGKTPLLGFSVTPGSHDITFVGEDGDRRTITVSVAEGDHRTVRSDLVPPIVENTKPPSK